jgi:hypothetical protein
MISAWPRLRSGVRLAMKIHSLSTCSHHFVAPVNLAHVILTGSTRIHRAVIIPNILLLPLPPYNIFIMNYFLTGVRDCLGDAKMMCPLSPYVLS